MMFQGIYGQNKIIHDLFRDAEIIIYVQFSDKISCSCIIFEEISDAILIGPVDSSITLQQSNFSV